MENERTVSALITVKSLHVVRHEFRNSEDRVLIKHFLEGEWKAKNLEKFSHPIGKSVAIVLVGYGIPTKHAT